MSYNYVKSTLKKIYDSEGVETEVSIMKEVIEYLEAIIKNEEREFHLSPVADDIAEKIEIQVEQLVAEIHQTHLNRIKARLISRKELL